MNEPATGPSPERRGRRALVRAGLAFLLLVVAMAALKPLLRLPFGGPAENHGIVSYATVHRENPFDGYLFYGLAIGLASALAVRASRALEAPWSGAAGFDLVPARPRAARILFAAALAVWLYNATWVDLARPLDDTFHEGEWLGFAPALAGPDPFGETFLIHGPGMNALPALAGAALGGAGRVIAWARTVRSLDNALAWAGAFAALWQVLGFRRAGAAAWRLFLPAAALFALLTGWAANTRLPVQSWVPLQLERSAVTFLLLAALLWALRRLGDDSRPLATAARGLVVGVLLPLGFLYNYSEAASGVALAATGLALAAAHGHRRVLPLAAGAASGAAGGAAIALLLVGTGGVSAMAEQIGYWSRYGRTIFSVPLRGTDTAFWLMVAAQASAVGFLAWRLHRERSLRAVARQDAEVLVTLAASLLAVRVALDRPDHFHTAWGAVPAFFVVAALAFRAHAAFCPTAAFHPLFRRLAALGGLALLLAWHAPNFDPTLALARLRRHLAAPGTPDAALLRPDYARAQEEMAPELAGASCFYTLTSEGVWYYLFGRPACSRFHQLLYARTERAQREVVEALERQRPPLVLHSNDFWSGAIDGVSFAEATPAVSRYVTAHYQPGPVVGQHRFWRRVQGK